MEFHASTDFELVPLPPRVFFTPHNGSASDPQQVHISIAGIDHIRITWLTDDKTVPSAVEYSTEPGNYIFKVAGGDKSSYQFLTYTSGFIHHVRIGPLRQGDGEGMRAAMEELLYKARVDVVFAGHIHAYERFVRLC
ncbi:unnamed protein product [Linum tenue]|uniref:Purple acid phosphatase N-terminal domain-containing protein n=1 Tax=Linum tenue TaxID=586396 RepID=A0AAV0KNA8_9ROSI|nr:unnamed protein product [Linum tenue]